MNVKQSANNWKLVSVGWSLFIFPANVSVLVKHVVTKLIPYNPLCSDPLLVSRESALN